VRVLVFGTFDRLHPGHEFLLREAKKRGELTVVIARDTTVKQLKGREPVQGEKERCRAVQAVIPEANVLLGDQNDFRKPLQEVRPDCVLLGYDQKLPPGVSPDDLPGKVERLPAFEAGTYKSSLQRQ